MIITNATVVSAEFDFRGDFMKVRIISAICGIVLFLGILLLSTDIVLASGYPIILTLAVALLSGIGAFEILHNTSLFSHFIRFYF